MPIETTVGTFEDEERANRTVRWLRRSGLHARVQHEENVFDVVVPAGDEERQAREVLLALEHTHETLEISTPTGWEWVRARMLNVESVGTMIAVAVAALLLLVVGIWLWALVGMLGWLALIVALVAGFAYFHFSGLPHSAVKEPRPYSHKHDITMAEEQQVQYRLAWAREEYRKSRRWRWPFRRKHRR